MRPIRLLRRLVLLAGLATLAGCAVPAPAPAPPPVAEGPVRVALLVPLGSGDGQREALAQSLVNAARLAERDLAGVALDLAVYPTGGDPARAAAAAQQAIDAGAEVFLGPLFSTATAAVAPVAQARGLQVLSFSNNPEIAGGPVHILGNTYANTARRIAGHATSRGLLKFAVIHPAGQEGAEARDAVRRAVAAAGGQVTATGAYPLSVDGIIGAAEGIARDIRGGGANAVVLTDGPTGGLALIAESLRGRGIRAEAVTFFGLQRWDTSPQAMAQPSLAGGFFAAPDQALSTQFARRYEAAYGTAPHPLAGLAYDGVAAIGALVSEARADGGRAPFSSARLTQPAGFAGVMGAFRFLPDGSNQRALAVYQVVDGGARQVSPAPRNLGSFGS